MNRNRLGNFRPQDAPAYEDILQCMRCGFCLPTCPTYALTGRERSSPRGRVALARAVAEKRLDFTAAVQEEASFCLDCRACSSACPSGVRAGEIMEICRAQTRAAAPLPPWQAAFRSFVLEKMLPEPDRLQASMLPARLYQRLGIQWLVRQSPSAAPRPGLDGKGRRDAAAACDAPCARSCRKSSRPRGKSAAASVFSSAA